MMAMIYLLMTQLTNARANVVAASSSLLGRVATWVHSNTHTYTLLRGFYALTCTFWVTMKQILCVQPSRTVLMGGQYA